MNLFSWNSIKDIFSQKTDVGLKLLVIFTMVYLVVSGGDHRRIKIFLICAGIFLIVMFVKRITQPLLWYVFLTILISDLICDYFVRANHHFLLIYITAVVIVLLHNSRLDVFVTNIKLLVVIVLFFSGIQKALSPQFVSGDFYYYMINTGGFFKPVLYFNYDIVDIIISNKAMIKELGETDPNQLKSVVLNPVIPNLEIISFALAWMTIIMEIIAATLILWKPKHLLTHIVFILLIMSIFFTRYETGFLALLAISGFWLTENVRVRLIYTTLAIVSLAFIVTGIGFY